MASKSKYDTIMSKTSIFGDASTQNLSSARVIKAPFLSSNCNSLQHIPDVVRQSTVFQSILGNTTADDSKMYQKFGSEELLQVEERQQEQTSNSMRSKFDMDDSQTVSDVRRKKTHQRMNRRLRKVLNLVKRYWRKIVKPIRIPPVFKKFFFDPSCEKLGGKREVRIEKSLFGKKIIVSNETSKKNTST